MTAEHEAYLQVRECAVKALVKWATTGKMNWQPDTRPINFWKQVEPII